jgi:hypothetical protein
VDFAPDLQIPGISAAQFALIQPDFDAGSAKGLSNSSSGLGVL